MATTRQPLTPVDSPIDLPEIRILISSYLTRHNLTVCILVCRAWHGLFAPYIWSRPLQVNVALNPPLQPPAPAFAQCATDIRDLKLHGVGLGEQENIGYLPCQVLCNLKSLNIQQTSRSSVGFSSSTYWDTLVNLARQNTNLSTFRLWFSQGSEDSVSQFWDAVIGCRCLKSLHLHHYVDESPNRSIFDILPSLSLHRLELAHSIFRDRPRLDIEQTGSQGEVQNRSLPTIKVLKLLSLTEGGHPSPSFCPQAQLISRCPNLQELFVSSYGHENTIPQLLSKEFADNKWPDLHSLHLHGLVFQDAELKTILESFGQAQLETLSLRGGLFGPLSLAAFEARNLGERIKTLNLVRTTTKEDPPPDEVSRIVQRIMEQSPVLESLTVDVLMALDVIKGRNWACTGLRVLKVDADLGPDDKENLTAGETKVDSIARFIAQKQTIGRQLSDNHIDPFTKNERQRALFRQLGQLHQLTVLDLTGWHYHRQWYVWRLNLDLHHGLDQLGELVHLKCLYFSKGQSLEMEDLEWMRQHWPNFQEISRCLHPDPGQQMTLQKTCTAWGWTLV